MTIESWIQHWKLFILQDGLILYLSCYRRRRKKTISWGHVSIPQIPFPPLFRNFLGCYEVAKDPNEKTIPHVEQTHFLLSSTWAIISSTLSARATWWLVSWFCGGRSRRHSDFRGYTRYRGTPTQPVTCHQFLQTSNTV